ncbi:ABC-F family ATP-binding cassette domain-containing protein [Alkalicoccus luteus]|uniref:ABC-F family ATP-binding cassette domain-containing protein n=1 Tax=Alkalicoccus luteus TaxID=1237094 RepID=A0A969PWG0_9BACI|nr:ABC-F family ATP-binding cassette domain-containing protein [Alkalicoccus luteus]NJP38749.1 ABC-F family ATP-binding cassette domain-containing protein [Alkalicoccus luteus]
MSLLRVENLVKTYGDKTLFNRISFTVEKKERIGVVGVNGTGKSSLLKAIAGREAAESGDLIHAKEFRVEYVPQDPELDTNKSVLETVFDGSAPIMGAMRSYEKALLRMEQNHDEAAGKAFEAAQAAMDKQGAWEASAQAKTILTKLGIYEFDTAVSTLSGGQKRRVSLARALIQPADLLLLDEPTNHLDNDAVEWLEEYLKQYSGALMLITHDRYFLNRVTSRMFELSEGNLYEYIGNYERFLEQRAERQRIEADQESKRQNILRRELAWLRRGAKARTTKQKARIQRAEDLQDQDAPSAEQELDFAIGSTRLGKSVIELENCVTARGGSILTNDFSFLIIRGMRLGIIGPNGSGKTTLLDTIAGRRQPDHGQVTHGETVKIGYYTQEQEDMNPNLRMIDYIKETAEAVRTVDGSLITAEQMLERFLFSRAQQWTYISRLSGGEKKRLYLLRVLMTEPNVLILDEPTNDLDTETLSVLEDYLDQFPGVVITVSHDRYFLDRSVSQLLIVKRGSEPDRFYGSYSDWLEARKSADKPVKTESKSAPVPKQKKKLSYKDQQEWNTIEDEISGLEEKLEELDKEIAEAGADFDVVREKFEAKEKTEQELESKMLRWEELSERIEGMDQS